MQKNNKPDPDSLIIKYDYSLSEEKIAKHPMEPRHHSKLLLYQKSTITHHRFDNIVNLLPEKSHLVFNNTKVIPARLFFEKNTGAIIEVFLLKPKQPASVEVNMQSNKTCIWQCLIGNKKRWKEGDFLEKKLQDTSLKLTFFDRSQDLIKFEWASDLSFAELIEQIGKTPLPPYLKRQVEENDKKDYQTIYSEKRGAVAAPTAGLHFTEEIFKNLAEKGITKDFITLHVSGGTFQPIKTKNYKEHPMHSEQIHLSRSNIENISKNFGNIIAVGTTSMRALESLYWFGVKLFQRKADKKTKFFVEKSFPYSITPENLPNTKVVLNTILEYMEKHNLEELFGQTEIYIYPSYNFKICRGLVTNYHQPKSTLILLLAAFVGDSWKNIYQEAIKNNYRFLSYGDSSLLLP